MGRADQQGPRGARQQDAEPPTWLIYAGYAGLMAEAAGRWLGGRWGGALSQAGLAAVSGGALTFFSHLLAWRAGRKRR